MLRTHLDWDDAVKALDGHGVLQICLDGLGPVVTSGIYLQGDVHGVAVNRQQPPAT
jgi:hypothetical protein